MDMNRTLPEPSPRINDLTGAIIGAVIEVHRCLGPVSYTHLESAYNELLDELFDGRLAPRPEYAY